MTTSFALRPLLLGTLSALLLSPLAAQAAPLSNGDFSQGLAGWATAGDATVGSGSLFGQLPLAGTHLLLSTATAEFGDDAPLAAGSFNMSGQSAVMGGWDLESSLGLAGGALDDADAGRFLFEGSSARQTFTVRAGDTLSFDWQVFTREGAGGVNLGDSAWLVVDTGADVPQATRLGETTSLALQVVTDGWSASAVTRHQVTFTSAGTVTLGWAVGDTNDGSATTVLAVRDVTVTAVPEPGSVVLGIAGLATAGALARRRARRQMA